MCFVLKYHLELRRYSLIVICFECFVWLQMLTIEMHYRNSGATISTRDSRVSTHFLVAQVSEYHQNASN